MARLARVVAVGYPHHITQRGNRRQTTFFGDDDCAAYLELMARWCSVCGIEVWPWSSARPHLGLEADGLVRPVPALAEFGPWRHYLSATDREADLAQFRRHGRTGRPCGPESFVRQLEAATGRALVPRWPGRPRKPRELEK